MTGSRVRGRPPDPTIERRVLAAALGVYGATGWAGFNVDAVARRARVGKAALYRRWPTKEGLLLAAMELLAEPPDEWTDHLDLPGCLTHMATQIVDMFVGPKAMVLPRVLLEAPLYPPLFAETVRRIAGRRLGTVHGIVAAAADRGELPPGTSPQLILDAIMGGVISRIVLIPGGERPALAAEPGGLATSVVGSVLAAVGFRPPGRPGQEGSA